MPAKTKQNKEFAGLHQVYPEHCIKWPSSSSQEQQRSTPENGPPQVRQLPEADAELHHALRGFFIYLALPASVDERCPRHHVGFNPRGAHLIQGLESPREVPRASARIDERRVDDAVGDVSARAHILEQRKRLLNLQNQRDDRSPIPHKLHVPTTLRRSRGRDTCQVDAPPVAVRPLRQPVRCSLPA